MAKKKQEKTDVRQIDFGRVPPQAVDMEASVLGALMLERDAFAIVAEILKPECFYKETHEKIYRAIVNLAANDEPVDMLTVVEQMRKEGTLDEVGGPAFIGSLTTNLASSAHLEYHAKIIAQKFLARELIRVATDIHPAAYRRHCAAVGVSESTSQSGDGATNTRSAGRASSSVKTVKPAC